MTIGKGPNDKRKGRYRAYEQHEIDYILKNMDKHPYDVAHDIKRPTESVRAKMHELRKGQQFKEMQRLHRIAIGLGAK